jgi:hypothetical protein
MKQILLFASLFCLVISCKNNTTSQEASKTPEKQAPPQLEATAQNTLTAEEEKEGWKLLFDGKTLNGWRNYRKETIGSGWVVDSVEHAIHLNAVKNPDGSWQAKDGGDIITSDMFENYEVQLDWKIEACGNSGIIFNVAEDPKADYVWHTGPELQVLDNACHPDSKIIKHRAGDLYDLISCSKETVKPAGEWTHVKFSINKGHLEEYLNGEKVVETTLWDDNWKKMIKGSKFKDMPLFGTIKKGHLALQDHGNKVWFRNIKVKNL